ncbi:MAG: hypothetical protein M1480_05620 [Bacteroidetes bacterium]|nr:hypothetical protein [Bacteroidota bacterium]
MIPYTRKRIKTDEPSVLIDRSHFIFNATLTKLAKLDRMKFVEYFIDIENRALSFLFSEEKKENSSAVYKNGTGYSYRCSADGLISKYTWIRSVAYLKESPDRRFKVVADGKFWTIKLRPSFEYRVKRGELEIPPDVTGIYRLVNEGSVVYIGKGQIKRRALDKSRDSWVFDIIEYSIISNDKKEYEAEKYWLERYKAGHNGELPVYNKISGVEV